MLWLKVAENQTEAGCANRDFPGHKQHVKAMLWDRVVFLDKVTRSHLLLGTKLRSEEEGKEEWSYKYIRAAQFLLGGGWGWRGVGLRLLGTPEWDRIPARPPALRDTDEWDMSLVCPQRLGTNNLYYCFLLTPPSPHPHIHTHGCVCFNVCFNCRGLMWESD